MRRKPTEDPILVDINGIATMLRVSPRTARRVVREPAFPAVVRIRGCVRWWRCDVIGHVREMTGVAEPMATAND